MFQMRVSGLKFTESGAKITNSWVLILVNFGDLMITYSIVSRNVTIFLLTILSSVNTCYGVVRRIFLVS